MAQALFDINADGGNQGFAAINSQVLTLRLRQQPPIGVGTVLFQVFNPAGFDPTLRIAANPPRASLAAPALTIVGATSGPSASPVSVDGSVTIAMPATGSHSWIVRCVVNGGLRTLPGGGQVLDPTLIHERGVYIPTVLGARKVVCTELRQFSDGGWADALGQIPDLIVADRSITYPKLPAAAAAPSFIGAAVNGDFVERPITTLAGAGLAPNGTTLDVTGSTSITVVGDQVTRAALSGAIVAAANANTTVFDAAAAGAGLTGGGTAILAVGAGTGITVAADTVAVTTPLTDGDKGDITVSANGTAFTIDAGLALSKIASQAANSVVANATAGPAVPTAVAAAIEQVLGRDGSATLGFFGIPWTRKRSAITSVVTVTNATTAVLFGAAGGYSIPANTLVAGTTYRIVGHLRYQRGATATAQQLRQGIFIGGVEQATTGNLVLSIVNPFDGFFQFDGIVTCLTTGAGGTGICSLRVSGNPDIALPNLQAYPFGTSTTFALNTTIANTIEGRASMSAAVAATSITVTAGYIECLP